MMKSECNIGRMKAGSLLVGVLAALVASVVGAPLSPQRGGAPASLRTVKIRPNFYLVAGAGANIAVQFGEDGTVLVDAGSADKSDAVVAAVKALTDRPIRYIINTSADADHVGGNERIAQAGVSLFQVGNLGPGGGNNTAINNGGAASIIATENVLTRMSAPTGQRAPYSSTAWPTETFTRKQKALYLNDEGIEIMAAPSAHTDGDSLVFFRRSDVIAAGDILDLTKFPVIDVDRGGSIDGEITALNRLIDLAIPSIPLPWKEGGTVVIPGHGRLAEQAELVEYRDMVTIVRDRVEDLMKSKMTIDQIRAARPTKGWNTRYGAEAGTAFVDAVYKSLAPKPAARPAASRATKDRR
jgi:cyclase